MLVRPVPDLLFFFQSIHQTWEWLLLFTQLPHLLGHFQKPLDSREVLDFSRLLGAETLHTAKSWEWIFLRTRCPVATRPTRHRPCHRRCRRDEGDAEKPRPSCTKRKELPKDPAAHLHEVTQLRLTTPKQKHKIIRIWRNLRFRPATHQVLLPQALRKQDRLMVYAFHVPRI